MPQSQRAVADDDADPRASSAAHAHPAHPSPREPMDDLAARAREQAEAQAAVSDVMRRVEERAAIAERALHQERREGSKLKVMLLLTLLAFNLYAWFGNPEWLHFKEPRVPSVEYYEASWKLAVYLQRQRIWDGRARRALHAQPDRLALPARGRPGHEAVRLLVDRFALGAGGPRTDPGRRAHGRCAMNARTLERGFMLIELLIVLSIVSILLRVSLPAFDAVRRDAVAS
jgi:prepilin-type N-terminal cleavage/methylation domain-containing protein